MLFWYLHHLALSNSLIDGWEFKELILVTSTTHELEVKVGSLIWDWGVVITRVVFEGSIESGLGGEVISGWMVLGTSSP